MTNELSRLEKLLENHLANLLAEFGFSGGFRGQSLYKRTSFGHITLHLTYIKHKDDFDVCLDVGIRFDQVEDLVNSANSFLRKSEKEKTVTLGIEVGNL